jgi:hypothetical protein
VPTTICQYWRPDAVVVGWPFTFVGLDGLVALSWVDVLDFSDLPHPDANPRTTKITGNRTDFCLIKRSSIAES